MADWSVVIAAGLSGALPSTIAAFQAWHARREAQQAKELMAKLASAHEDGVREGKAAR